MHQPINTGCGENDFCDIFEVKKVNLTYTKEASNGLFGESDADQSGDVNDRKSTTGYYFKLN